MGYVARGLEFPTSVDELPALVKRLAAAGDVPRSVVGCPLMHGTGMWLGTFIPLLLGGSVVTATKLGFDPDLMWSLVEQHRATSITIVGDAFARPMLAALNAARDAGQPFDLASLTQIVSSGVMWSAEVKEGLLEHHDMELVDTMGSTEGGMGSSVTSRDRSPQTARFELSEGVKVFSDDGRELQPGDEAIGRVATSGLVPIGYYKDPVKSAETFREIDGVRYSFPGDYARVESDGSITLLGRGSVCINTAGEKVFPEEVEEVVKRYETVLDCLVVGVPDERFGERVVAVTSLQESAQRAEQEVIEHARAQLAGYKVPKHILFVDAVRRAPNGKPDYKWARRTAEAAYGA
jgi:fatty-acyl-CoA synthase